MKRGTVTCLSAYALFTTALLFLVSLQSYTHDLYVQYDSTWYFMCGKAWMNGLSPYVDFADSKGPLLWLLFGLAYKLSPCTFVGVFWLLCVVYTALCWTVFKTARLFLRTDREAFPVPLLLLAVLFNKLLRNDVHTEDFSVLLLAVSLFFTCRQLHTERRSAGTAGLVLGLCFGAALLIKFTASAMILPLLAFLLHRAWRQRQALRTGGLFLLGVLLATGPFLVYFAWKGTLATAAYEYFVQTAITTQHGGVKGNTRALLLSPINGLTLLMTLPGLWLVRPWLPRYRWFPLVAFLVVYVISVPNGWANYLMPASLFSVFSWMQLSWLVRYGCWAAWQRGLAMAGVWLWVVGSTLYLHNYRHPDVGDFFTQDNQARRQFYSYEYIIAQVPRPRLLYLSVVPPVYGVCSNSLPACKYFAWQYGMTPEMEAQVRQTIVRRQADFVMVNRADRAYQSLLRRCGYRSFYLPNPVADHMLFAARPFRQPPSDLHVDNLDVLLKRPFPPRQSR